MIKVDLIEMGYLRMRSICANFCSSPLKLMLSDKTKIKNKTVQYKYLFNPPSFQKKNTWKNNAKKTNFAFIRSGCHNNS